MGLSVMEMCSEKSGISRERNPPTFLLNIYHSKVQPAHNNTICKTGQILELFVTNLVSIYLSIFCISVHIVLYVVSISIFLKIGFQYLYLALSHFNIFCIILLEYLRLPYSISFQYLYVLSEISVYVYIVI